MMTDGKGWRCKTASGQSGSGRGFLDSEPSAEEAVKKDRVSWQQDNENYKVLSETEREA